ncbi:uncharacterized protein LOC132255917 [Phlebotomus argentipes]|uniref:uncharacterized protein LOC132255917 n=1 Tax=Phlebotomus argentipes TaxID=94469 RepID=UPI002892A570|nr:uncharacterized protein LOC132255917 [Phlebotomus argentipes]
MKFITALLVCALVAVAVAENSYHGNGQPGCRSQAEVDAGWWRHNWDPTSYWWCSTVGQAAVRVQCTADPNDSSITRGWQNQEVGCVPWSQWVWTPPVAPPSEP